MKAVLRIYSLKKPEQIYKSDLMDVESIRYKEITENLATFLQGNMNFIVIKDGNTNFYVTKVMITECYFRFDFQL